MSPFGAALLAYKRGKTNAEVLVRRDDGVVGPLPIRHFFRESSAFTRIEREALGRCQGRVLDVGAGAGVHSLELQKRGIPVTAVDICQQAVWIMKEHGVRDVTCSDVFSYRDGGFHTILLMGHGIGMMETIAGLDRFLTHAPLLLSTGGRILLDSMDPAITDDPRNLAYHATNRRTGKYIGEVRMSFEFDGVAGPYCGWLHVDPETLCDHATSHGWSFSTILREASGDYLAQLTLKEH